MTNISAIHTTLITSLEKSFPSIEIIFKII